MWGSLFCWQHQQVIARRSCAAAIRPEGYTERNMWVAILFHRVIPIHPVARKAG